MTFLQLCIDGWVANCIVLVLMPAVLSKTSEDLDDTLREFGAPDSAHIIACALAVLFGVPWALTIFAGVAIAKGPS